MANISLIEYARFLGSNEVSGMAMPGQFNKNPSQDGAVFRSRLNPDADRVAITG